MKPNANFVGREKELRLASKIIRRGQSLVIEGAFGIGKTSFSVQLGALLPEFKTLYCTFEKDALKIVETLNRQLVPSFRAEGMRLSGQIHFFLKHSSGMKCLIIIDDIWKVTLQKIRFFKRLNVSKNCQFIFVSEVKNKDALYMVKSISCNTVTIPISKLNLAESLELFERRFRIANKTLVLEDHKKLVQSCKGYPLNLITATHIFAQIKNQK